MFKDKKFWLQPLWMAALTVPWGIGGFIAHTGFSLSAGLGAYWLLGLVLPFFFFVIQNKGYGAEVGPARGIIHLPVWISLVIVQVVVFWNYLTKADIAWKTNPIPTGIGVFLVLLFFAFITVPIDYMLAALYHSLKEKGGLKYRWLASAFFTGLIPGTLLISMVVLFAIGETRLDPFTGMLFLMEVMTISFWMKIALAMMTFGIYLFTQFDGSKGRRAVQTIFTAVFWLMLAFIPFIISTHLPSTGSWRAYGDPSYLSIFLYLSDLWLTGFSIWGADKLTNWIFKE